MGCFSNLCVKSIKKAIESKNATFIDNILLDEGAVVLIPEEFGGGYIKEEFYEGYGEFGNRDIYGLVVEWNAPDLYVNDEESRCLGISMACYAKDHAKLKYPIRIICEKNFNPEEDTYELYEGYFSDADTCQGFWKITKSEKKDALNDCMEFMPIK